MEKLLEKPKQKLSQKNQQGVQTPCSPPQVGAKQYFMCNVLCSVHALPIFLDRPYCVAYETEGLYWQ
jgi:hypothetical protein